MTKDEIQQAILDALTQHVSYTTRLSSASVNEILAKFDKLSNEQLSVLRDLLDSMTNAELTALSSAKYTTPALKEFKSTIDDWMTQITAQLQPMFVESAIALTAYEASYIYRLADKEAPAINGKSLYGQFKQKPYAGGMLVDQIFPNVSSTLRKKLENTIRDGVSNGQTTQEIVKRIKGTKALNYNDGILEATRKDITTEVRTARNHLANEAYSNIYKALGVKYVKFLSTLDGRTSPICVLNSDKVYQADKPHPIPPLHRNCRSQLIPCDKDGNIDGMRPFVESDKPVSKIPKDQREGIIGQVDANTTFAEFFANADKTFQRNWLGPTRMKLYETGKYPITKFIDPLNGSKYTLAELKKMDEQTFKSVGL